MTVTCTPPPHRRATSAITGTFLTSLLWCLGINAYVHVPASPPLAHPSRADTMHAHICSAGTSPWYVCSHACAAYVMSALLCLCALLELCPICLPCLPTAGCMLTVPAVLAMSTHCVYHACSDHRIHFTKITKFSRVNLN